MEEKIAVDAIIARKQDDWETLIRNKSIVDIISVEDEALFRGQFLAARGMAREERGIIGNLWFHDAVHGRRMEMPQNSMELQGLLVLRSPGVKLFISVVMLCQIGAIFFEQPGCDDESYFGSYNFFENHHVSRFTLTIFDLICALMYTTDIMVGFVADPWRVKYVKKSAEYISRCWILVRLFCSLFIIMDCIHFFAAQSRGDVTMRVSRIVFPVVFLSRRENLKQMVQGMLFSAYYSLFVQGVLFVVLFVWGSAGFFLFHNIDVDNKFSTFFSSILTTLHCYSSRPTVLYVLNPFFLDNIFGTAFWAVTLSIVADIMVTSLIIAMGKRYYRDFGIRFFRTRLSYRRDAVIAIFTLFCNRESDGGELNQDASPASQAATKVKRRQSINAFSPTNYGRSISTNSSISEHDQLEIGNITFAGWLELCSSIEGKYALNRTTASLLFCLEDKNNSGSIGLIQFARLCAVLASRVRVIAETTETSNDTENVLFSLKGDGAEMLNAQPNLLAELIEIDSDDDVPTHDDGFELNLRGDSAHSAGNLSEAVTTEGVLKEIGNKHKKKQSLVAAPERQSSIASARDSLYFIFPKMMRYTGTDEQTESNVRFRASRLKMKLRKGYVEKVLFVGPYHAWTYDLAISFFFHILLIIQLLFVSRGDDSDISAWLGFGWFLEIYFILDMALHLFIFGKKRVAAWCSIVINAVSFVAMCILGVTSGHANQTILVLLLVTQSSRLMRMFEFVERVSIFRAMIPTTARALFIVSCIMYSFACFAHVGFCTRLTVENVDDNTDDDASAWLNYSNLLNFHSYLLSLYTMYAVSTASNWSIVMDAAAEADPVFSLIFFYGYRLLMALFVLPILFGFIIQCYIQCYDMEQKDAAAVKKAAQQTAGQQPEVANVTSFDGIVSSNDRITVPIQRNANTSKVENEFTHRRDTDTESVSSTSMDGTRNTSVSEHNRVPSISSVDSSQNSDHSSVLHNITGKKHETTMISLWSSDRRERLIENPDAPVQMITTAANKLRETMRMLSLQRKRTTAVYKQFVSNLQKPKSHLSASDYSNNPLLRQVVTPASTEAITPPVFPIQQWQMHDCRLIDSQNDWSNVYRNPAYIATPSTPVVWFKSWMGYTESGIDHLLRTMSDESDPNTFLGQQRASNTESVKAKGNPQYDDETNILQPYWPWSLAGKIPKERVNKLALLYFSDAVHGRAIEHPATDYQLRCYQFVRSHEVKWLMLILLFLLMLGPLIEVPYCANGGAKMTVSTSMIIDGRPSRLLLSILDMCYTTFFVYEAIIQLSTDFRAHFITAKLHEYVGAQLLIYVCIYLDCITFFFNFQNPRYSRVLFPFILLARDNNLRQMLQGLGRSMNQSSQLYRLIFMVLILWGFFGCLFFRRITDYPHFENPFRAAFTCLHCFTSSPYALLVLNQYFNIDGTSGVSPVYFTTLTVIAELLLASLLIATGTMQYKIFSKWNLSRRLALRKNACSAAYQLLIQTQELEENHIVPSDRSLLTRASWRRFCSGISTGKYNIDSYSVDDLFSYVADGETLEKGEDTMKEKTSNLDIDSISNGSDTFVDEKGFFRLCALLSCQAHSDRQLIAEASAWHREGSEGCLDESRSSIAAIRASLANAFSPGVIAENGHVHDDSNLLWKTNKIFILNYDYDEEKYKKKLDSFIPAWFSMKPFIVDWLPTYTTMTVYYSRLAVTYTYMTPFSSEPYTHFESISNLALALLFLQLLLLTQHPAAGGMFGILFFGFILECVFIVEMIIRISAMGWRNYLNATSYLLECLINILSLIFMIIFSEHTGDRSSTAFFAMTTLQCMRFQRLFWYVPGASSFQAIRPIVIRVVYVFFGVIYAFSILAHAQFCGHLSVSDVSDDADDDSSNWIQFSEQLNFTTYLQSMYTLFEMTILGNWSIVMDAAAATDNPAYTYIFFYTFRLLMTLVILPLLMAFVIQSFITANDQKSNHKDMHEKMKRLQLNLSPAELNEGYREANENTFASSENAQPVEKGKELFTPFMETLDHISNEEGDTTANLKESSHFITSNTFVSLWSSDLGILGGCPKFLLEIETQQKNAEEELLCHDRYMRALEKYNDTPDNKR